ncbi:MAG: C69 family dipeptidase, partial [Prevotella bivia]|nr:C69 family dipeptidase [Prevotella bivia]
YEGTALALDNDIAAGPWNAPYRPTPLAFEVDGKKYFNERPTSTQQTAFSYIAQLRSFLPREIGGVIWWGNDDGNMVAYVPIYCGVTTQPECFNTPNVNAVTFSDKNAFWVCNWVANMVYPRYALLFPSLKEVRDNLEASFLKSQPEIEAKAKALYGTDKAAALALLSDYSHAKASEMMDSWRKLATYLIVKFNDMAVKPEKDGKFLLTPAGMGATVARPGYSEYFKKQLVKQTGDRFAQPE